MHRQGRSEKRSREFSEGLTGTADPKEAAVTGRAARKASGDESPQSTTDDIVRLYLREMGRLPRLSRADEVALGEKKERAYTAALRVLTSNNYVATRLVSLIETIQNKRSRLDRTIDIASNNSKRKEIIHPLLSCNGSTIRGILQRNRSIVAQQLSRTTTAHEKAARELSRGKLKVTRLLSEIHFREAVLTKLKNELKLFALETSLLKTQLHIARLGETNKSSSPAKDPATTHDESLRLSRQKLHHERESIEAEIAKHTGATDAQLLLRPSEELRALEKILRRLGRRDNQVPSDQEAATRLKAIISTEHALKATLAELTTIEHSKHQYDTFDDFEKARADLLTVLHKLAVEQRLLKEQRNITPLPEEISAMKWALRERLLALGESPKAALQRIARHDHYEREFTAAVNAFVRGNLRLVVSLAKKKQGLGVDFQDLIQWGNEGLLKAAKKFDHSRGFTFGTYATWWIRQGISRSISEQSTTVRLPVDVRKAIQQLKLFDQSLTLQLGRNPSEEERLIAYAEQRQDKTSFSSLEGAARDGALEECHKEIQRLSRIAGAIFSLEDAGAPHAEGPLSDIIPVFTPDVSTAVINVELRSFLFSMMEELTPREKTVLIARHGLGPSPLVETLDSLRNLLGITRERVRQIQKKAESKIRQKLVRRNSSIE